MILMPSIVSFCHVKWLEKARFLTEKKNKVTMHFTLQTNYQLQTIIISFSNLGFFWKKNKNLQNRRLTNTEWKIHVWRFQNWLLAILKFLVDVNFTYQNGHRPEFQLETTVKLKTVVISWISDLTMLYLAQRLTIEHILSQIPENL